MKVAVTGATGFIGRHVLQELANNPDVRVTAASRGQKDSSWLPSGVVHVPFDVASPSPSAFDELGRPDVLIHLAWSGLPNYRQLHHFEQQLGEQYRFLSGMVKSGLRSLVCTGTCFEYGMRSGELHEALEPAPRNPYGFAKDALRRELTFLRDSHAFSFTWARLFYMYGDHQPATSLYAQLSAAVGRGDTSFKMSAGEQLRDYLHVREVARTLVLLALRAPDSGVVNICSGQPVSIRRLVEKWLDENGWKIDLELGHFPYPDYEPLAFWGSRARLEQILAAM